MASDGLLRDLLFQGIEFLGLDLGIISQVNGDLYKVVVCAGNSLGIKPGDEFELSQTYCSDVIKEGKTKYYQDVAQITEMLKHPCYLNTQLRAYIGTPIILNEKMWGTLNFSSLYPHKDVYSQEEIEFMETKAKAAAEILKNSNF